MRLKALPRPGALIQVLQICQWRAGHRFSTAPRKHNSRECIRQSAKAGICGYSDSFHKRKLNSCVIDNSSLASWASGWWSGVRDSCSVPRPVKLRPRSPPGPEVFATARYITKRRPKFSRQVEQLAVPSWIALSLSGLASSIVFSLFVGFVFISRVTFTGRQPNSWHSRCWALQRRCCGGNLHLQVHR